MEMSERDREVRFRIYQRFAATGRPPSTDDVAAESDLSEEQVVESFERLAAAHAIALAPGTRSIWMAHPFSAVPTPYPVRTAGRRYWANCAWDALGVCAILGVDGETTTQCADCGEPLVLRVVDGRVTPEDAVVHFLVPPKRFWDNVGFT